MNRTERIAALKAMALIARAANDETAIDYWLTYGIADGDEDSDEELDYYTEDDMPQTKLCRDLEGGMAVSVGRLREDTQYDYKFVCVSHNTLRGAAGGAVLLAELLCAKGWMD